MKILKNARIFCIHKKIYPSRCNICNFRGFHYTCGAFLFLFILFMKKVFVSAAIATLTLSSCAVGGTSDYASLYDAHVKARLTQMESVLADAGLNRHVE